LPPLSRYGRYARAQWLTHEIVRREDLYKEFIEAASRRYVHALQHGEPDVPAMVDLYAKLGRMRVLSSPGVPQERGNNTTNNRRHLSCAGQELRGVARHDQPRSG